ncbi:flagellar hook-length control protein FliK [Sulfurimonas marina]|uniref:Flagellar hook-length control protein FliK n=1 Tax=Sulfurimonas marina TaxID=2590551 RepID=A0A7M1AVX5_9BACT|nr:flagellar hook-length control protein FliK [Sulfurimonas marina]QOP41536.1 flagellar hook-length control protein FliK [Sulfurimonas marina]
MIKLDSNKLQNIVLPSTNKALAQVLKDIAPSESALLSKAKDLSSILNTIFKESATNELQNQKLLELLKNNPTLKELGNIKTTIKELLGSLENEKQNLPIEKHLKSMLSDIKNIDDKVLKAKLENSGIFLESKLKNLNPKDAKIQELLSNDFKAALLKTKQELESSLLPNKTQLLNIVDKLSLQIDYYQLVSHLSNGAAMYIPYEFNALEDGNFTIKKDKNNAFFCDIELNLKKYGELRVRLGLFEKKYLNVNISTQNQELKQLLQSEMKELKEQLNTTGLLIKEIRFLDPNQTQYASDIDAVNLGFEAKV